MKSVERFLAGLRRHKVWAWLALLIYAAAVTFPHQPVENVVSYFTDRYTNERVWLVFLRSALIGAAGLTVLFLIAIARLRSWAERMLLVTFWVFSIALMAGIWREFMTNNAELVHFPQYFPEGIALIALTGSVSESLVWIAILGGLDEAFQYIFVMVGKPVPFDLNDVYMDLAGGAAGVVLGLALMRYALREDRRDWLRGLLATPGVRALAGILCGGLVLLASGRMTLYDEPGSPSHWFALSRHFTPGYRYVRPWTFGLGHLHELTPFEGTAIILITIALYSVLDRYLQFRADGISSVRR
ncbi:MAG TPA: hypothetical protein VGM43_21745 [Bryobacteraceae bacterium]|jgi:hypothetical protein